MKIYVKTNRKHVRDEDFTQVRGDFLIVTLTRNLETEVEENKLSPVIRSRVPFRRGARQNTSISHIIKILICDTSSKYFNTSSC